MVMREPDSLLVMYTSAERGRPRPWLVQRNKQPKSQHVVIFQTTETNQLPFVRWKVKTLNLGYGRNPNSKVISCSEHWEKRKKLLLWMKSYSEVWWALLNEYPYIYSEVSEHTIKLYSNLSCCIHTDVNKRQITGGKNKTDKIQGRRRNIFRMINLRFGVRALPLIPKVWRKADRIYRKRTVFSPSAI